MGKGVGYEAYMTRIRARKGVRAEKYSLCSSVGTGNRPDLPMLCWSNK